MPRRFLFTMNFRNSAAGQLAILLLSALGGVAGGCSSPPAPAEPVRVEFLFAGTTVNAVPIGSGRLLTVASGVPGDRENVATVTTANGWRSTGTIRVLDRGVPAGQAGLDVVDAADDRGLAALDRDWSILWFESGPEPTGVLATVEPAVGDQITIRGFGHGVLRHPTSLRGVVVEVFPADAGPRTSFLVRQTGGPSMSPGMSGAPVFVERQIAGGSMLLLAGILQARAEGGGDLDGLLRCIVVPSAARPGAGFAW